MHNRTAARTTAIILGFIFCTLSVRAQIDASTPFETTSLPKSYPIHGSDLLWKNELAVQQYLRAHPDAMQRTSLQKTTVYSVGSTKSWYADNMLTQNNADRYLVPSTCRAVGSNCYIFVEDANWDTQGAKVSQKMVDSVRIYFDSKTPANATKGIYQTDVDAFGNPPDVDGDPKINILLLDIKDGYTGSGGYVAGYFYSFNEVNSVKPGYKTSNYSEIFFIDVNPSNLSTSDGLNDAISTLAHEFQHMIHFNYDPYEIKFVNEGCSTLAEVNCGFPIYSQSYYAKEPNHFLFDWRTTDGTAVLRDYSRAARFFVYLRDQVGMGVFKSLVASPNSGTGGIDAGLQAISASVRFNDILKTWFVANILDDKTVNPSYGYVYPNLTKPIDKTFYNPNVSLTKDTVYSYAVRYISFKNASQLKATFTVSNPALLVKAVEIGPSTKRVLDVPSGVEFSEPLSGSTYPEIVFVVMNTSESTDYTFTYQASGTGQSAVLGYSFTEPSFADIGLINKDSICVVFDAVKNGNLDSIRVALRRGTNITGGIWKYSGSALPTPLGQQLTPFTVKGLSTPPSPYPVPWPNWVTVDLRAKNINTNSSFAVGFVIDGAYSTDQTVNRVMITTAPIGNGSNSLTYSQKDGARWHFYVSNDAGDSAYYYLVRAYVSFGTTGVRQTAELTPARFNLSQNYPNPFNPSTAIQYSLPTRSFMTLKVYDMVGREVATLVNGFKEAGSYEVSFDASRLPSGVYLYRITTDRFVETKKLVLIK